MIKLNKIERLEKRQSKLANSVERKKIRAQYRNSQIEAKLKKLEEKSVSIWHDYEKYAESTNLKLEKNARLILAEAEYAKRVGDKYKVIEKK